MTFNEKQITELKLLLKRELAEIAEGWQESTNAHSDLLQSILDELEA
jgi:hypothetical protein